MISVLKLRQVLQPKTSKQEGFKLSFEIDNQEFTMNAIGQHTVENATAAVAVCQSNWG